MSTLFEVTASDVADTNDEWYTPRWIFGAAGLTFDLDVCAPVAPEFRTCPARRYLTVLEDGLTAPWDGLVWMNPPYSCPRPWIERWIDHPDGLALAAATRSMSTGLLLEHADAVAFFTGQFHRPNGNTDHNPWLLCLAARGAGAIAALQRIAVAKMVPAWLRGSNGEGNRAALVSL